MDPMHVINYSRDSEGSGAGFWVSRVSFQGLYGRVSLQGPYGRSKYYGGVLPQDNFVIYTLGDCF